MSPVTALLVPLLVRGRMGGGSFACAFVSRLPSLAGLCVAAAGATDAVVVIAQAELCDACAMRRRRRSAVLVRLRPCGGFCGLLAGF